MEKNEKIDQNQMKKLGSAKAIGPINIALIKYWGKNDEEEILPMNNSLSVTLDMNSMYSQTEITLWESQELVDNNSNFEVNLKINNEVYKPNKRQIKIIGELVNIFLFGNKNKLIFEINSINTFPTAAGCASSASGGACLVTCLKGLFINVLANIGNKEEKINDKVINLELSSLARRVSGSASRSVYGGFVEWQTDGFSKEVYSNEYWTDFRILLLLISNKTKDYSSTDGMKLSKETSEFLDYRVKHQVTPRLESIKNAIKNKNIAEVCEIAMRDSNSFHAVCRDTFPPLLYMNETSDFVVKCVNVLNNAYASNHSKNDIICGYSFDAGPNAFIFTTKDKVEGIKNFFNILLSKENKNKDLLRKLETLEKFNENESNKSINFDLKFASKLAEEQDSKQFYIEDLILFEAGCGSKIIS